MRFFKNLQTQSETNLRFWHGAIYNMRKMALLIIAADQKIFSSTHLPLEATQTWKLPE